MLIILWIFFGYTCTCTCTEKDKVDIKGHSYKRSVLMLYETRSGYCTVTSLPCVCLPDLQICRWSEIICKDSVNCQLHFRMSDFRRRRLNETQYCTNQSKADQHKKLVMLPHFYLTILPLPLPLFVILHAFFTVACIVFPKFSLLSSGTKIEKYTPPSFSVVSTRKSSFLSSTKCLLNSYTAFHKMLGNSGTNVTDVTVNLSS